MGFLAPALPWIAKGGAMLAGGLLSRNRQQSAMKKTGLEKSGIRGLKGAAGDLSGQADLLNQQGTSLISQGSPAVGQATNYYSTLLRGSRPAMALATAGPRAAITDTFRGAERGLERSGVRGAARDVAVGDLQREKASKVAGLTTGVQPGAANALAGIGSDLIGQGAGLMGQGTQAIGGMANIYQALLTAGMRRKQYADEQGQQAGEGIGGFLFDILSGGLGKSGGGTTAGSPGPWATGYRFPT